MNQIPIKSSVCNTPEVKNGVKSRETEIKPAEKNCLYLEILRGDLSWFFACTYHSRWHFKWKSFAEIYLVQFSVNYNMPFFDVS